MHMSDIDDDDRPQNEDDLDEDEEEEEEEEVAETAPAQPAPAAPNPVPPASVGVGKPVDRNGQPRKRKKKKRGEQEPREAKPQDPAKPKEGDLMWEWVIDKCTERGIYPGHVNIRIARIDVGREVTVGNLQGDRVLGDDNQTAAEALYEAIVESFHIPAQLRGPILYNVIFSIKGDRGFSHRGQINLPSVEEINRRRQSEWYPGAPQAHHGGYVPPPPRYSRSDRDREGPRGYGRRDRDDRDRDYDDRDRYDDRRDARRGVGAPPPATHSQPYPPQYGPPPGYYDDRYDRGRRRDRLEREIDDLKDLVRDFIRGGGNAQPQQQQGPDFAALQAQIQHLEKTFGVKFTVAGLGAPPAPAQLPQQARDPESQEFEQVIARKVRTGVGKRIDTLLEEILDPETAEKRRARRQAEEEDEEDEDKPEQDIDVVDLPVPFPGTEVPLRYAKSRETGEFSIWPSIGLNLPVVMDRHGDKLIDLLSQFAKGGFAGLGGRPQPPQQMPPRQNVNGSGVGHAPPPPAHEPPPPPPRDDDDDFRL